MSLEAQTMPDFVQLPYAKHQGRLKKVNVAVDADVLKTLTLIGPEGRRAIVEIIADQFQEDFAQASHARGYRQRF